MRLKLLFMTTFLFLSKIVGQSGYWNDFSSGTTTGWGVGTGVSSSKFTINNTNQELVVNSSATNYDNFEHVFSSINIGANPVLKIKVKSANAFTMRIDLTDANGKSTNAVSVENLITTGATYKEYSFNYKGKFKQNFGGSTIVDSTKITKISIFLNGGSSFSGTVYLDDLIIGDKIKSLPLQIRLNQIGYEAIGPKTAIIETDYVFNDTLSFGIYNTSGQKVYGSSAGTSSIVDGWGNKYFRILDFSGFNQIGIYTIRTAGNVSFPFEIGKNMLFNKTSNACIDFFKNMRNTDTRDLSINLNNSTNKVNVYGGWWDATGDPGKHMSHLSYANYFNPQQIPLVVWSILKSFELNKVEFSTKSNDINAEAAWGADYLLRNIDKQDYLYLAVFDDWGNSPNREVCEWGDLSNNAFRTPNYQAAMREGAGVAIAALAKSYLMNLSSTNYSKNDYLNGAVKLYNNLKSPGIWNTKNLDYCNDHKENIIDMYCGLLAALELFKATSDPVYELDAHRFANELKNYQKEEGWFAADIEIDRPFYHASDEGLPIVALVEYANTFPSKNKMVESIVKKWFDWYKQITYEIANPFQYIGQYNKSYDVKTRTYRSKTKAYFVPRENETGYWWQGENARMASMTTAANYAGNFIKNNYNFGVDSISSLAISQLDWIAGKNPFGVCMIYGFGSKTYPDYVPGGANKKPNVVGGICNGITGNSTNTALEFMPYNNNDGTINWQNWRWVEQWLPHTAWWLLAVSTINNRINNPYYDCNNTLGGTAFVDSCGICASGTTGKTAVIDKANCTVLSTSDIEVIAKDQVEIHPNPSNGGLVTLTFNSATEYPMEVLIIDNTGKTIIAKTITENNTTFKTNELKNGLYNVNIKTRNGILFTKKLSVIN
jgi:hypothetical protein